VESLPKTISGKIKRYELRDMEMKRFMENNSHSSSECRE
jgi:acetyl-CoA synthetase